MAKTRKEGPVGSGRAKTAQAKAQDDQVMSTNSSSIVSKRSVEKLYYPDEPHFFRFFVKKFQRRAPLINRGYHLRLHVIDVLVRDFLMQPQKDGEWKQKVVVNLGCGSDVLPWQCLSRYPDLCKMVKFVDVDFSDLIERKRQTVEATPELKGMLKWPREPGELAPPLVFESNEYVQIGCDLRDLKTLREGLEMVVDVENCSLLFVAEVSITYMETDGADNVIEWASSLGDAEFVLLEQILPSGKDHPFATTMLNHFNKLNTPIKSVATYPTLDSQLQRFSSRGFNSVLGWTLWQAWADERFLSAADRRKLDEVEPFDEWEEFALFASHYCLIHASTKASTVHIAGKPPSSASIPTKRMQVQYNECPGQKGQRRFGAAMQLPDKNDTPLVVNVMGLGTKARLQSCDVYNQGADAGSTELTFSEGGPATRMCHTLTDLGGDNGVLLAGGRGSPSSPLKDCWLFNKSTNLWSRTQDLPLPLYRHAVTNLGGSGMALLVGGKGLGAAPLSSECLLYQPRLGWVNCEIIGEVKPAAVYGAVLAYQGAENPGQFSGLFAGGLQDGLINEQILCWDLVISGLKPIVKFTQLKEPAGSKDSSSRQLLARFGATCFQHGDKFLLVGGVIGDHLLDQQDEILACSVSSGEFKVTRRYIDSQSAKEGPPPRPLFVGVSTALLPDGRVVVVGGGATCFSMGTFWNKGVYALSFGQSGEDTRRDVQPDLQWVHRKTIEITPGERSVTAYDETETMSGLPPHIEPVARVRLETQEDFTRILKEGRPVVLEGLNLGKCVSAWSLDYLVGKVGNDRNVVIHESSTQAMDFNTKNFRYVTTSFEDFARRVEKGDMVYLRALSDKKPTEKPALLTEDFPTLASDFALPPQLSVVRDSLFSSVLRASGCVNMWLHYDVMANVYCQIGGSKRLVLFPPRDVEHLSFTPGASSSSIDVFANLESAELAHTHPHETVLSPGEVLFLPPLWLHTAKPTSGSNIAVNVFFKDLGSGNYAAGRDVYGNRDLAAYEKGRQDVARIANSFHKLPAEAREFYLLRLADELQRKARG
ncbi:methyltransferase-like protein [Lasiosphaeris hirsuta]|uniref:tRNA wybutosine-synthesizing protein 4 n=1 Tax=Lasiosphaeris hirsuta TaxID=260670 RepID=A0AA40DL04_9PEZI|nr:methyltransferase-like protein [Lasiosphaeris hirsuta]